MDAKERLLERATSNRETLRREFEAKRDAIMNEVPEDYKRMLGQIGFTKWSKTLIPVLIVSPYDVPPGEVRDTWIAMFEKMKSQDRLESLAYLIYFYGANKPGEYYNFIQQRAFVPHEKEKAKPANKSVHKLPARLQKKVDSGAALSSKEQQTVRAYSEMEEDLLLPPTERQRGIKDMEDFDVLSDGELDVDLDPEEVSDHDGGNDAAAVAEGKKKAGRSKKGKHKKFKHKVASDGDESEEPFAEEDAKMPAKEKTAKKKGKKKAKKEEQQEVDEVSVAALDDIGEPPPPEDESKPKKRGRPKKSKEEKAASKKKRKNMEAIEAEAAVEQEEQEQPIEMEEPLQPEPLPPPAAAGANVDLDDIGEVEEDSADEDKDPSFDAEAASEDDEAVKQDADFEETTLRKVTKKERREKKSKIAKKAQKVKHKEDRPKTDDRKKKVEKEALTHCEKNHLCLVERWISCIQERNVELLRGVLADADVVMEEFSATFIYCYGISVMMKNTKAVFKEANAEADLKILNSFRERLKESFNKKNALLPKNYEPKLARQDIADKAKMKLTSSAPLSSKSDLDESQTSVTAKADSKPAAKEEKIPKKEGATTNVAFTKSPPKVGDAALKSPPQSGRQNSVDHGDGKARAVPAKAIKPKFSLGSFMGQRPKEAVSRETSMTHEPVVKKKAASGQPSWWKDPPTIDPPTEELRSLALEFLLQAAEHFDPGTVNGDALGRMLEAAIYEWAQKNNRGIPMNTVYWDKVHAVVAAICGKYDRGSLLNLIAQGSVASPDKIAALSEDQLHESFEGRPLHI